MDMVIMPAGRDTRVMANAYDKFIKRSPLGIQGLVDDTNVS